MARHFSGLSSAAQEEGDSGTVQKEEARGAALYGSLVAIAHKLFFQLESGMDLFLQIFAQHAIQFAANFWRGKPVRINSE